MAGFAVHVKKNGGVLAEEEGGVSAKHFRFVSSAFLGYRNVVRNVRGLVRSKLVILTEMARGETKAARKPWPEHKPYYLLRELISCFGQPGDLFAAFFHRQVLSGGGLFHGAAPPGICRVQGGSEVLPSGEESCAKTVWKGCCSCWLRRRAQ